MRLPPIWRDLLAALAFVGVTALLAACGGGGDEEACRFEVVTLADGRTVPAPNNCPAVLS